MVAMMRSTLLSLSVACSLHVANARRVHPAERMEEYGRMAADFDGGHIDGAHIGGMEDMYNHRRLFEQQVMDNQSTSHNQATQQQRQTRSNVPVPVPESPDAHLVTSLPLMADDVLTTKHWAGLLPASADEDKYLFYWLFEPDFSDNTSMNSDSDDVPLILWLNGGPACSSMDGLWLENGPLRLQYDHKSAKWQVVTSKYSWHRSPAYTLYLDQPVGTGLSYTTSGKYPRNDEEVNVDVYYFLQQFFLLHADKMLDGDKGRMRRPFYWSGESHAGHYIPSMMNYIRKKNIELEKSSGGDNGVILPLAGAAIGNGYFSPMYQYSAQEAAYGHGIIGKAQRQKLDGEELECQRLLKEAYKTNSETQFNVCFNLLGKVKNNGSDRYHVSGYDVRVWESSGSSRSYPKGHKVVESYLGGHGMPSEEPAPFSNRDIYKDVLKAIHSEASLKAGQQYEECTDPPYSALAHQDGLGVETDVIELLEQGNGGEEGNTIRLLFFNGIEDLICNHVGNEVALEQLNWKHRDEWTLTRRFGWRSKLASQRTVGLSGYMKEFSNLSFLKVLNSGHMVPMDVPDVALDMMRTFVYDGKFNMYQQQVSGALEKKSCPKEEPCPVCPSPNDDDTASNSSDDSDSSGEETSPSKTTSASLDSDSLKSMIGYALAIVMFLGILIGCCVQRFCSKPSPAKYSPASNGNGIELRSSYTDHPIDEDDEVDDEERFT